MRPAEVLLCFSFGTENLLQATAGGHLSIGLENRRWATILEFESLRFRHLQSPD